MYIYCIHFYRRGFTIEPQESLCWKNSGSIFGLVYNIKLRKGLIFELSIEEGVIEALCCISKKLQAVIDILWCYFYSSFTIHALVIRVWHIFISRKRNIQSAKILLLTSKCDFFLPFKNGNFSNIAIAMFDFSLLLPI